MQMMSLFVYRWGTHATVAISKPEDAKCVLMADVKHLKRVEVIKESFFRLLGNGLLLIDGEEWEHHRNIMRPAFFAEKIKVGNCIHLVKECLCNFYTLANRVGRMA